jgi:hypothetical protein
MATQTTVFTTKICALLLLAGAGCSSSSSNGDAGVDAAVTVKTVAINEVFPHGDKETVETDWVELKNLTAVPVDLTGYQVRDEKLANMKYIPDGTVIPASGYLIINCLGTPDAGIPVGLTGVVVPFKLSGSAGDEFHLVGLDGMDVDETVYGIDVPSDKSWGRLPDGTGMFIRTSPTKGLPNI